MKNLKTVVFAVLMLLILPGTAYGSKPIQNDDVYQHPGTNKNAYRRHISIPDVNGYHVLKCDFHVHTVFTDAQVWPAGRVNEAWNDGLDAIAITDHIEVHKNIGVDKENLNLPNEIAMKRGGEIGMIVIPGAEITRKKPFGHMNALFISDANRLKLDDPVAAVDEAIEQGAYVFLNHPGWPDDDCTLYPVAEKLIQEDKIKGIEFYNNLEHYPKVFDWCKKYPLALLANSDIHAMSGQQYPDCFRPMTLVFAKERSAEGIKEALFAGRVVAFYDNHLTGPADLIGELIKNSLEVKVVNAGKGVIEVHNRSDIVFQVRFGDYMYPVPLYGQKVFRTTMPSGTKVTFTNCVLGRDEFVEMAIW